MAQYLSSEQRAQFENQLANENALSDEAQQQALEQGMQMAESDLSGQGRAPDADAALLAQNGFESTEQLLEAYTQAQSELNDLKGILARLTALSKALHNTQELDPADPDYTIKRSMRVELEPVYKREREDARNRLVQGEWKKRATAMRDIQDFLPEMADYIMAHPEYALEEGGLERAYDAVRAGKYRSEESMLADLDCVKRLSNDERIRNAVLTAHMADVYKAGRDVPSCIDDGGNTPATQSKGQGMDKAKSRLLAMLNAR